VDTVIMASNLMFQVKEKYKELKERQLVQGPKKDDEIIVLKAELEAIKKAPKRNNSETGNETTKQKKTKWMYFKPKGRRAQAQEGG
jgi:transposase